MGKSKDLVSKLEKRIDDLEQALHLAFVDVFKKMEESIEAKVLQVEEKIEQKYKQNIVQLTEDLAKKEKEVFKKLQNAQSLGQTCIRQTEANIRQKTNKPR